MSLDARVLLQKADTALAAISTGGLLNPAQGKELVQLAMEEAVLFGNSRVVTMEASQHLVDKVVYSARVLRAGAESTSLPAADRAAPTFSKVTLTAKLFKAETRLSDEVTEDTIEKEQLINTIKTLMGKAIGRDIDEIAVRGDTASADTTLAQLDGLLKQITTYTVAAGIVNLSKAILKSTKKTMPNAFIRDAEMVAYTSVDAIEDYKDSVADRATPLGDSYTKDQVTAVYGGTPLIAVPKFPENQGVGTNETSLIFTHRKNIIFGIWRDLKLSTWADPREGDVSVLGSIRFDTKFEEETAAVKAYEIKVT